MGFDPVEHVVTEQVREKNMRELVCANCGKTFYRKLRKGTARFCGSVCRSNANNKKVRAQKEAKAREAAKKEAALDGWCRDAHKTWASKARCLYPGYRVVGEGQVAVMDHQGGEIRLWATKAAALRDSIAEGGGRPQIVTLHRGPHRKGKRRRG